MLITRTARQMLERMLSPWDYSLVRRSDLDRIPDVSPEFRAIVDRVKPATMTTPERIIGLCRALEYVVRNQIHGDFVECGVYKGGSTMAAALTLLHLGVPDRTLCLFDTFEGMSEPTEADIETFSGQRADALLASTDKSSPYWAYAPLEQVRRNLTSTGYPPELLRFIKGRVEDTLPSEAPDQISVLRLDTDWYESTKHELDTLFPRLSVGGVLIIDDYGFWSGARKAVDEYFQEHGIRMLLNRLDFTGHIGVKS
jgi:hypothetical protein